MATDSTRPATEERQLVLDVEDARDIGPAEAEGLLRECIALTQHRLDAALVRALDDIEAAAPELTGAPTDMLLTNDLDTELARAVRRERARFLPHFNAEFDETFAARRAGKMRKRETRRSDSMPLALVGEGDLGEQVALKGAVNAMRAATQEDAFGFDLRVRLVMREQPTEGAYENPWNSDYVCDALGNTCRALWPDVDLWRPTMERMVRALTAPLTALHHELNVLLQDRDILPVLNVRTRSRGRSRKAPELDGSAFLGKLLAMYETKAAAQPSRPLAGQGASAPDFSSDSPLDFRDDSPWHVDASGPRVPQAAQPLSALMDALNLLQRGQTAAAGIPAVTDAVAAGLRDGTANELPAIKDAIAGSTVSMLDRVTIEIVAALLDEIFDDDYLPAEIKTVFGRLQIAILKAALLDPRLLADPNHRVRQFFETLAAASVGLRPGDAQDVLFIALADQLATRIRDEFADDLAIFDAARDDLAAFLDAERAGYNKKLAEALPSLLAHDEYAAAETKARDALAVHAARADVPPEIRAFLDHECVERMASAYVDGGPASDGWTRQLQLVDDLLWSIARESGPAARKRLTQLIPQLVRRISEGWASDATAQARRKALMARLYDLHVDAMKSIPESAAAAPAAPAIATASMAVAYAELQEAKQEDDLVADLMRGDWCAFRGETDDAPVLARFAWRAPHDTCLLFTYRNGATAFIHTPETLAAAFDTERATVAVEAVPLFERAMTRLMDDRSRTSASVADA